MPTTDAPLEGLTDQPSLLSDDPAHTQLLPSWS